MGSRIFFSFRSRSSRRQRRRRIHWRLRRRHGFRGRNRLARRQNPRRRFPGLRRWHRLPWGQDSRWWFARLRRRRRISRWQHTSGRKLAWRQLPRWQIGGDSKPVRHAWRKPICSQPVGERRIVCPEAVGEGRKQVRQAFISRGTARWLPFCRTGRHCQRQDGNLQFHTRTRKALPMPNLAKSIPRECRGHSLQAL